MLIGSDILIRKRATWRVLTPLLALFFIACSSSGTVSTGAPASEGEEQPQQGFVIFTDIPMPANASVELDRTIVLGTGEEWMGRVTMKAKTSFTSVFDFYSEQMPEFGWKELTVLRSGTSVLTYERGERIATIQIQAGSKVRSNTLIIFSVSPRRLQT